MIARTAEMPASPAVKAPRVAFYIRISTDEDHQKYSLPAQTERLEAYCTAHYGDEWEKAGLYRDTESGTHMNRPGLVDLLADAEAGKLDTLLVFRVDRLSRKVHELARMVEELTRHGVVLKSITEPFDTGNAAGKMMLQMLGVFAEFEHATIVERTKVGMEKKAREGKFVGHTVPYGYRLDESKQLVIHEEEALLIRKVFRMYADGREGADTITRNLNEAGHRRRSGRKWDRKVILSILKNPIYMGKIRWKQVVHDGHHEPIVPEEVFGKTQEILGSRTEDMSSRRRNAAERLLTGRIRCRRCRSNMVGVSTRKNGVKIPYYICTKRASTRECDQDYVRADHLEESIINDVRSILRDEQLMARVWQQANERLSAQKPDLDKEVRRVEADMQKTRATIGRYFAAFEAGDMEPAICNAKVKDLTARLEALESERKEVEASRERLELPPLDRETLEWLVEHFDQVMATGTNPQKKHLLHQLVKKVLVSDRDTIEVWYFLPEQTSVRTATNMAPRM